MKAILVSAMVLIGGCATTTAPAEAKMEQGAPKTTGGGFVSLADGKLHAGADTPTGFHVNGTLRDSTFEPSGDVQGEGALGTEGQPAWMELKTGKIHGDQEAMAPQKPYVRGFRAADGSFAPSARTVSY